MDRTDYKILRELQRDGRLSSQALAEKVGLSTSPCWRRVRRMERDGVLKSAVAILDPQKVGLHVLAFAQVSLEDHHPDSVAEFDNVVTARPEILECHTVFGEMDIVMKVLAQSLEWYQKFIFDTVMKLPGVQDIQSTVTLMELKSTTEISLGGVRVSAQD